MARRRKYGSSTRKGMKRKTARKAYYPKRRKRTARRRIRKSNPAMFKGVTTYMKKHPLITVMGGMALGYVFRWTIADSPLGEPLDKITGLLNGAANGAVAVANGAVNGNGVGAIGMGAVHDPYGAVHINPYGAVHINPAHSLAAEHAARNAMHSYQYPPPGLA